MTTPFTEYEIGKYYEVPCIRVGSTVSACARKGGWIPVLLPWHEDAAIIGFPEHHYHYDPRFIDNRLFHEFDFGLVIPRHPVSFFVKYEDGSPTTDRTKTLFTGVPIYRRLKCKRQMPRYVSFGPPQRSEPLNGWPRKLETAYAHDHLRNGICPHKGIDLTTCPVVYGVVTCPGHGLRWNVETGKLVKRWPEVRKDAA